MNDKTSFPAWFTDSKKLVSRAVSTLEQAEAMSPGHDRLELFVVASTLMTMGLYSTILADEGFFETDDNNIENYEVEQV